jgi:NAD(P)-dependent dehydrogenase (short-subunit alcohol dehydrogenase family)
MIRNNSRAAQSCGEDFHNRLAVITGATSGIGYRTAVKYASHGADLLCVNRDQKKSALLKDEIEGNFGVSCSYIIADLSRLQDTHRAAAELQELNRPIDVLIHNAGVYLTKKELSPDGIEKVFAVHYLSPFIINFCLRAKLSQQSAARIILVNSEGHRFAVWGLDLTDLNWEKRRYSGLKSYGSAKTAQLLSMIVFNEIFQGTGVTINAVHPGAVKTETGQENGPLYKWLKKNFLDKTLKSPDVSAEALYYLGASKEVGGVSGKFFNLTSEELPAPPALDRETAYALWEKSIQLAGLRSSLPAGEKEHEDGLPSI